MTNYYCLTLLYEYQVLILQALIMQNFVDLKLLASQAIFLCGLVCKVILNAPKNSQQFPMWYLAVSVAIFCVGLYTKRPILTNLTPPRHNSSKGNLLTCETTFYMPGRPIDAISGYLQDHYFVKKNCWLSHLLKNMSF